MVALDAIVVSPERNGEKNMFKKITSTIVLALFGVVVWTSSAQADQAEHGVGTSQTDPSTLIGSWT